MQEVASWKAVHKAFVSPAQRFSGGGVKAGPHPDAIIILRPRYLYLQYQGHLKGGSLSMIKHISFELTTAFDKSRMVPGTVARGGAFLPELATGKRKKMSKQPCLSIVIAILIIKERCGIFNECFSD
ncbi:MAG TPA: hypothetical protein GXX59_11235 [Syntrophomonadaceae bacterium]|nr:hypothetical protein [Syntrophomonadaceae bacterium]